MTFTLPELPYAQNALEPHISANTLSFHLKELMNADLVTQERDGRRLIYRAGFVQMNAVMSYLTANCCQGQSCELQDVTQCAAC